MFLPDCFSLIASRRRAVALQGEDEENDHPMLGQQAFWTVKGQKGAPCWDRSNNNSNSNTWHYKLQYISIHYIHIYYIHVCLNHSNKKTTSCGIRFCPWQVRWWGSAWWWRSPAAGWSRSVWSKLLCQGSVASSIWVICIWVGRLTTSSLKAITDVWVTYKE